MSLQSQIKNMKLLTDLLSQDLGYIYGEKESGPNGAKKQFHSTGRAFLSALGKDLGFAEQKVYSNKAGIACSGEVTLMGMWNEKSGLYIQLRQDLMDNICILYRSITHLRDYTGGENGYISLDTLKQAGYISLVFGFLQFREKFYDRRAA